MVRPAWEQTALQELVLAVFVAVYLGMAFGRWPGLRIDRTGIALLGAIVLFAAGAVSAERVLAAIDFPTLVVLFGLMVLSAQFAACGFYDRVAAAIALTRASPATILALVIVVAGLLSAVLANDVVVWAITPLLCRGLASRGLDPRPFLIALTGAANAGSAATLIGNPQNILIGSIGHLDFWAFAAACAPPALAGLVAVWLVVRWQWRQALVPAAGNGGAIELPPVERSALLKACFWTVVLLAGFTTPIPHTTTVLVVAGALLVSRRFATRRLLGLVDWHLLVLFGGLFVVTTALADTGLPTIAVGWLEQAGLLPDRLGVLAPLALIGSNTIGNVPIVMLILGILPDLPPGALYALAALSTLSGNLLIIGSLANIITVERAAEQGVRLGFLDHARAGVPMTLLALVLAMLWLYLAGYVMI
ncbi:MAG TPA: SLC13 family permease [Geminicoccus sp.]|jgi:Na+/H+ antiporter NhaD/arsenite permease-like protein|uniref:SLC13 family permease n=1 Tax=Geminicoccus sp. TaxID=2024832 RepID=UPI002E360143|nr:SLC13 family permease [Geminicoccus sp.]HEX2529092.1 SLC13 family permease [Geminicoccus sp.]